MINDIKEFVEESAAVSNSFFSQDKNLRDIVASAERIISSIEKSGKLLVFGNGGSAADSQHFAAEMVVRFKRERRAFPCIALSCNTSVLTAHSNDYSFDTVYSRQIEALGRPEDIAFAISTSGNSPNVLRAVETAREKGMSVISLTGSSGGRLASRSDHAIVVPGDNTAQIQQVHITVIHVLCDVLERSLFSDD